GVPPGGPPTPTPPSVGEGVPGFLDSPPSLAVPPSHAGPNSPGMQQLRVAPFRSKHGPHAPNSPPLHVCVPVMQQLRVSVPLQCMAMPGPVPPDGPLPLALLEAPCGFKQPPRARQCAPTRNATPTTEANWMRELRARSFMSGVLSLAWYAKGVPFHARG